VLELPDPDRSQLVRSALDLVVCQIRFDRRGNVSTPRIGFDFQKALAESPEKPWKAEPVEGPPPMNITVTADGTQQVSTGDPLRGWRFTSPGDVYIVVLMPDSLAVETRRYTRWSAFRETAERAIACLTNQVAPEIEMRVGLRYVDRLEDASIDRPAGWAVKLQPALHGLVGHEQLGAAVLNQQQQIILNLGEVGECRFGHGTLPTDHGLEYVLDYDLYRQDARPFDGEAIIGVLDLFNTEALKLFQASVTADTAAELR
jgi:uncharacterized protein (TIGR04255 family)